MKGANKSEQQRVLLKAVVLRDGVDPASKAFAILNEIITELGGTAWNPRYLHREHY